MSRPKVLGQMNADMGQYFGSEIMQELECSVSGAFRSQLFSTGESLRDTHAAYLHFLYEPCTHSLRDKFQLRSGGIEPIQSLVDRLSVRNAGPLFPHRLTQAGIKESYADTRSGRNVGVCLFTVDRPFELWKSAGGADLIFAVHLHPLPHSLHEGISVEGQRALFGTDPVWYSKLEANLAGPKKPWKDLWMAHVKRRRDEAGMRIFGEAAERSNMPSALKSIMLLMGQVAFDPATRAISEQLKEEEMRLNAEKGKGEDGSATSDM